MSEPKQVIVMRNDLNMRKGKMVAQGAHASLKVIMDEAYSGRPPTPAIKEWMMGKFTKICVYVDSEQELVDVYNNAKVAGIPCALIVDAGRTEFNGVSTITCCAIGPEYPEKIDPITRDLPLL